MTRGIAALMVLVAVSAAEAQGPNQKAEDDSSFNQAETREERRERIREARQEWRERVQEAREERRRENRERMERFREHFRGDGVHLRIFRDYTLAEGETSNEPIVVIGGSARIDGRVDDDVVVVGGGLHLGPKAIVEGNAVSVMGEIELEPGAAVHGSIDEAVAPWGSVTFGTGWNSDAWWKRLSFWGSMSRLSLTLAVAVFLTLAAPGWIGTISDRTTGASILTGLAIEVLFVPALAVLVVALIVSIVGIPLLATIPLLLAAFALIWIAGFTGVAVRLGRTLRGKGTMTAPSVVDFLIGYAIIIGITVIAQAAAYGLGWLSPTWPMRSAGLLVEYVAWTIGLGAAVTSLFTGRRVLPPPLPA